MGVSDPALAWRRWEAAILEHLEVHPHAADSAAGVARWWLDADPAASADDVEKVLAVLVASGLLRRSRLSDGTALYSKEWSHPHH
jgi:Fe2+ or Zn2+ uptake regulation protein